MHKKLGYIYFTMVMMLVVIPELYCQISSPTPYTDTTQYAEDPQDIIYVFYKADSISNDSVGSLSVSDPSGCDTCDFLWYRFNFNDSAFSPIAFHSGIDVTGLPTGGYKVQITNQAGYDTGFIAWVFVTYLNVNVVKDTAGKVTEEAGTCDCLDLEGYKKHPKKFFYHDMKAGVSIELENKTVIQWTFDPNKEEAVLDDDDKLKPRVCIPPYFDVEYTMNVYDKYRHAINPVSDMVLYESEIPHAAFKEVRIKGSHPYDKDTSLSITETYSAPALVKFTNDSKNAISYKWILVDSAVFAYDPNFIVETHNIDTIIEYTYYIPRTYNVTLIAISEENCPDTLTDSIKIIIKPSFLDVPNVFYPGHIDYGNFMLKNESIKYIRVRIFDRWGRKVHEYEGDIDNWNDGNGWDGNVHNSNRPAAPGLYFYVIEARGWDNTRFEFPNDSGKKDQSPQPTGEQGQTETPVIAKGWFYLFRDKN